ncbi:MAG: PfkB family carbohydrate kinase [Propioniciclava sp.]|uniref:carbohydrate kinase family protein n=1 Tax=Propioniciclava sp. TaxID=2038686 RepID=UPI0039E43067
MRDAVVFLGVATHDTIVLVDHYPGPDERVVVQALETAGGGPAATAAVACVRLGVRASFVGSVGADAEGARIIADLTAEGVDAQGVSTVEGRSGASVVIVDAARATRAICNRPAGVPQLNDAALRLLTRADWVHVDQLGWQALTAHRDELPATLRVSVDAGNPIPGFAASGVALYVPTIAALRAGYGDRSPEDLLHAAIDDGVHTVVATDGSRGSWGLERGGEIAYAPAASGLPIRSTLGAGDVFHGALLSQVVRGVPLADALVYANHVAAASCGALDGRSGIPTHAEVAAALGSPQEDR